MNAVYSYKNQWLYNIRNQKHKPKKWRDKTNNWRGHSREEKQQQAAVVLKKKSGKKRTNTQSDVGPYSKTLLSLACRKHFLQIEWSYISSFLFLVLHPTGIILSLTGLSYFFHLLNQLQYKSFFCDSPLKKEKKQEKLKKDVWLLLMSSSFFWPFVGEGLLQAAKARANQRTAMTFDAPCCRPWCPAGWMAHFGERPAAAAQENKTKQKLDS